MKKGILVLSILSSSLLFAQGGKGTNFGNGKGVNNQVKYQELTDEEKAKLDDMRKEVQEEILPVKLDIEAIDISIRKELLNEKIDWEKVENLIGEKAEKEAGLEVEMLKNREEHQEEFGFTGMMGRGNFGKGMNNAGKMRGSQNGFEGNNGKGMTGYGQGRKGTNFAKGNQGQMQNLTAEQEAKLNEIRGQIEKEITPLRLDIEAISISVRRELLNEKVDWKKVEKLTKEKIAKEAETELKMLKLREEHKDEFGFGFMGEGRFGGNMNGNGKMMGNGMGRPRR